MVHSKDTNYEDDIYYNTTITEQEIIPVKSQQVNSSSNQTSTTIGNNNYLSFAQAFREARNSGLSTFTCGGKLYTTQLAKVAKSQKNLYTQEK